MKKLLLAAMAMAVLLSMLAGCDNGEIRSDDTTESSMAAFDCYDNLATAKGLELYVWETEDGEYRCGLMQGTNRSKTAEEIAALPPATAEEMSAILASYELPGESISVIPIVRPQSRYQWELDGAKLQQLRELFGVQNVIDTVQTYEEEYASCYDSILADIDNDGINEVCTLGYGFTSGVFTFTFTASVDGETKYLSAYCTEWYDLSFTERDGSVFVQGITQGAAPETHLFAISVENGTVILSENGEQLDTLQVKEMAN